MLVLEKMTGKVIRINENGEIDKEPVLVVCSTNAEGGLLGIHVFLYFTEHRSTYYTHVQPKNTVYQYDWDGKNLTNPIFQRIVC